jgi:methionyl-tRNA formyltransferase
MVKIVYFGTLEYSATVLQALAKVKEFSIEGVVTQPAKPVGRAHKLVSSPVKIAAEELRIPIFEPTSLKTSPDNFLPKADIFIVYGYGLLIPKKILDLPTYGALNIHPSLLPNFRGPTPVQTAILQGETKTGVSIILLDEQMDHGPILDQFELSIEKNDTTPLLTTKLINLTIPRLIKLIPEWINKKITPQEQNHGQATLCKLLARDDGKISFQKQTAEQIYNHFRAYTPWPGTWTLWNGKRLKLLQLTPAHKDLMPGQVHIENQHVYIGTVKDAIEITTLQLEGKKPMEAASFIAGYQSIEKAHLE